MPYRFVEDEFRADSAFEASGRDLSELFVSAAQAVTATMVHDPKRVEPREERPVRLEAPALERLLHRFLQELVYQKDVDRFLYARFEVQVQEGRREFRVEGRGWGEPLDPNRHEQLVDVKAVTWHRFHVERSRDGWSAFVVLDV